MSGASNQIKARMSKRAGVPSPAGREDEMPRGPHGEKRPQGDVEAAVMVGKIATGEIEEELTEPKGSVLAELLEASAPDPSDKEVTV